MLPSSHRSTSLIIAALMGPIQTMLRESLFLLQLDINAIKTLSLKKYMIKHRSLYRKQLRGKIMFHFVPLTQTATDLKHRTGAHLASSDECNRWIWRFKQIFNEQKKSGISWTLKTACTLQTIRVLKMQIKRYKHIRAASLETNGHHASVKTI